MRDRPIELLKPHVSGTACLCESGSCELTSCRDCKARRLSDYLLANGVIVPPCKVGDKVYVITDCSQIMMYCDNDYLTGTGAIECPFEDVCNFTDCNDDNTQVLETYVNYMGIEDGSK